MAMVDYLTWWLSPGVACFLFLNVLVAAIAFTSRSRGRAAASTRSRRLCRSASSMVLDRLWSFAKHPSMEFCYWISPEAEELKPAPDRQLAMPEPAATAAISTTMAQDAEDESAAGVIKSMISYGDETCALGQEGRHAQEPMPSPPPPAARPAVAVITAKTAASVAALVRGLPKEEEHTASTGAECVKRKHHRRRDHVYAVEGKAELNARAEQFIRQFRQELQLQRLDSMLSRHGQLAPAQAGAPTSR